MLSKSPWRYSMNKLKKSFIRAITLTFLLTLGHPVFAHNEPMIVNGKMVDKIFYSKHIDDTGLI